MDMCCKEQKMSRSLLKSIRFVMPTHIQCLYFRQENIKEMNIEDIWNSKKALSLYSPSKEEIVVESTCSSCSMFDKCRKNLAKKICYVDIMKVHKHPDFPDPKCPQSQQMCNYIL